jgi:hypothetical protein
MKRLMISLFALLLFIMPVFADVVSITITPEEAALVVGEEVKFAAEANDGDGNAVEADITWAVVGDIGEIDNDGEFTATAPGTGTVTASVGEVAAEAIVIVTEGESGEGEGGKGSDDKGNDGEGNGSEGEGSEGEGSEGEGSEEPIQIFPDEAKVEIGEIIKFEATLLDAGDGNADVTAIWSVDGDIGEIDEEGEFTATASGTGFVVAVIGDVSGTAEVEVVEEGATVSEGHSISIKRLLPNGNLVKFGSTVYEGGTVTIGGIPSPMNYLNGTKVYFPEGSLSDDITITIKIPIHGKVNDKKEVEFEGEIVTAVTFEVSVDGEVVSPYEFTIPLEVSLPYKRGLLEKLGINPEDLGMYYVGQSGELVREGISNISVNEETDEITGTLVHFSDVALAPKASVPTAVEENILPTSLLMEQNYPNPFNPKTTISYYLPENSHVRIDIYNIGGQHVKTLINEVKPFGEYSVTWNGTDFSGNKVTSGVYICSLKAGNFMLSRKLMLMK